MTWHTSLTLTRPCQSFSSEEGNIDKAVTPELLEIQKRVNPMSFWRTIRLSHLNSTLLDSCSFPLRCFKSLPDSLLLQLCNDSINSVVRNPTKIGNLTTKNKDEYSTRAFRDYTAEFQTGISPGSETYTRLFFYSLRRSCTPARFFCEMFSPLSALLLITTANLPLPDLLLSPPFLSNNQQLLAITPPSHSFPAKPLSTSQPPSGPLSLSFSHNHRTIYLSCIYDIIHQCLLTYPGYMFLLEVEV